MTNAAREYIPYLFIGLPIILTFLLYYFRNRVSGNRWKAIHTTTQWTAPFYIIAVSFLLNMMFQSGFLGYILVLLIMMLAIILILQWKAKTEVILVDGLRIMWRINFILFAIIYIGLIIIFIVQFIQRH